MRVAEASFFCCVKAPKSIKHCAMATSYTLTRAEIPAVQRQKDVAATHGRSVHGLRGCTPPCRWSIGSKSLASEPTWPDFVGRFGATAGPTRNCWQLTHTCGHLSHSKRPFSRTTPLALHIITAENRIAQRSPGSTARVRMQSSSQACIHGSAFATISRMICWSFDAVGPQ